MKNKAIIKEGAVGVSKAALGELVLAMCSGSPESRISDLAEKAIQEVLEDSGLDRRDGKRHLQESVMSLGIDTHAPLAESVGSRHSALAISFCNDLIGEYRCRTAGERATAQIAANAYVRVMEFSRKMEGSRSISGTTHEVNGYYAVMSKELDRANRHYVSALGMLRQLRAPSFHIWVTAKNAFVAQNQQLNVNRKH